MRKYSSLFWYVALFLISFLVDRATKFLALSKTISYYKLNKFLALDLVFNRGMSWGMCSSKSSIVFFLVSLLIFVITIFVAIYGYKRFKAGHAVIGEVLVVSGSISNILDRILYGGVVDFIALSLGRWHWPVFNVADMCIVLGVFIIMIGIWKEK